MKSLLTYLLIYVMALGGIFVFESCTQEQPASPISEAKYDVNKVWTAEEVNEYFANFDYPEDPKDYVRQFYGDKHISQMTAEDLILAKAGGGGNAVNVGGSSVYFYVDDYDDRDDDDFEDCQSTYGDMFAYIGGEWMTDTDEMTSTATTTAARNYANNYCYRSDISSLEDADAGYDDCFNSWDQLYPVLGKVSSRSINLLGDNSKIMTVPSTYVKTDLNPDFEDWTSGNPDAWLMPYNATYSIPALWAIQFPSSYISEYTGLKYNGSASAQINLNDRPTNNMASYYYELPAVAKFDGLFVAKVYTYGTDGSTDCALGITLYNSSDQVIDSNIQSFTNMAFSWVAQVCTLNINSTPKYVRFTIIQLTGQTNRNFYVDGLSLTWEGNDVSLPVSYANDLDAEWSGGSSENVTASWSTHSEEDSWRWALFSDVDSPYEMVSDYETAVGGSGVKSTTSYYVDRVFELDEWFFDTIKYEGPEDVYLGAQDLSGEWEFFPDDAVTITVD